MIAGPGLATTQVKDGVAVAPATPGRMPAVSASLPAVFARAGFRAKVPGGRVAAGRARRGHAWRTGGYSAGARLPTPPLPWCGRNNSTAKTSMSVSMVSEPITATGSPAA